MQITIYGSGCAKCKQTEALVREVVDRLGVPAEIVKVADPRDIAAAGVLMTPAVGIDGTIKLSGRLPRRDEIAGWLGR